jgi:hypothetical protein
MFDNAFKVVQIALVITAAFFGYVSGVLEKPSLSHHDHFYLYYVVESEVFMLQL